MRPFLPFATLLGVAFLLGCQEQASSPVGPESLGVQLDKKTGDPPMHGDHGGGENGDDTFTVEVFFEGTSAGSFPNAVAKGGDSRPGLELGKNNLMTLNIDLVDTDGVCDTDFGSETGQFAISVARIPKSSPNLTFVTANFFNFEVGGVDYGLSFAPDGDGEIEFPDNWLPANSDESNSVTHDEDVLELGQKNGPCNGRITQDWEIRVTKN